MRREHRAPRVLGADAIPAGHARLSQRHRLLVDELRLAVRGLRPRERETHRPATGIRLRRAELRVGRELRVARGPVERRRRRLRLLRLGVQPAGAYAQLACARGSRLPVATAAVAASSSARAAPDGSFCFHRSRAAAARGSFRTTARVGSDGASFGGPASTAATLADGGGVVVGGPDLPSPPPRHPAATLTSAARPRALSRVAGAMPPLPPLRLLLRASFAAAAFQRASSRASTSASPFFSPSTPRAVVSASRAACALSSAVAAALSSVRFSICTATFQASCRARSATVSSPRSRAARSLDVAAAAACSAASRVASARALSASAVSRARTLSPSSRAAASARSSRSRRAGSSA